MAVEWVSNFFWARGWIKQYQHEMHLLVRLQYHFTVLVSGASVWVRALQTKEEDSIFIPVTPLQLCNSLEVRLLQTRAVYIVFQLACKTLFTLIFKRLMYLYWLWCEDCLLMIITKMLSAAHLHKAGQYVLMNNEWFWSVLHSTFSVSAETIHHKWSLGDCNDRHQCLGDFILWKKRRGGSKIALALLVRLHLMQLSPFAVL